MHSIGDVHVLIVDDNRQMRQLLRSMLHAVGVRVVVEADSVQAARRALGGTIDLVLLDWQMQPVDGLAFTREIRWGADSPRPFVPIVMLTAHTEIHRVAAARDAGINGFVKKPVSAQMLLSRVSSAITDHRMFVKADAYRGPDRRRVTLAGYGGPFRRQSDQRRTLDTFDLDDMPMSA